MAVSRTLTPLTITTSDGVSVQNMFSRSLFIVTSLHNMYIHHREEVENTFPKTLSLRFTTFTVAPFIRFRRNPFLLFRQLTTHVHASTTSNAFGTLSSAVELSGDIGISFFAMQAFFQVLGCVKACFAKILDSAACQGIF